MNQRKPLPRLTSEGILFTVTVDSLDRECLIKKEALRHLTALTNDNEKSINAIEVFQIFENRINGVARRLVAAGVQGTPLVLTQNTFVTPNRA